MRKKRGSTISVKGFTRLQIVDKKTQKVQGDSGWLQNQVTDYGLESCIVGAPIGAASVQAAGLRLGSGSVPASNAAALPLSHTAYYSAFAYSSVIASLTARMSVSFDGSLGSVTLSNIGGFANSSGSLLWGNTYASSALAITQSVNCSYDLVYTTS